MGSLNPNRRPLRESIDDGTLGVNYLTTPCQPVLLLPCPGVM